MVVAKGEYFRGGGDGYHHAISGEANGFDAAGDLEAASDGDEAGAQHAGVVNPLDADVIDILVHLEIFSELFFVQRHRGVTSGGLLVGKGGDGGEVSAS